MAKFQYPARARRKTEQDVAKFINNINKRVLSGVQANITKQMRAIVIRLLKNTDTYRALTVGSLRGHFGLTEAQKKIDTIIAVFSTFLKSKLTLSPNKGNVVAGNITITIEIDYETLLSLPEAQQLRIELIGKNISDINLLEGTSIIIRDYHVVYDRGRGRSGLEYKMAKGGSWKVPYEYSGRENNNFITETLKDKADFFKGALQRRISQEIKRIV